MDNTVCWYKNVCDGQCSDSCIRFLEMKNLIELSGIPLKKSYPIELYAGVDYDVFCILADIKDYITEHVDKGDSFYICSRETGNGKTSWAIKLMLKYFNDVWAGNGFRLRGLFVHVPTFLLQLKDFSNQSSTLQMLKEQLPKVDLVIWDDLASTQLTAYDSAQLLTYIDARVLNGKSSIYTGNIVTKEGLDKALGARLASRIWNYSEVLEFKGKDRR